MDGGHGAMSPQSGQRVFEVLVRAFLFVSWEWQHLERDSTPDQGFEKRFRETCLLKLTEWRVSYPREMGFGSDFSTASGIAHEIDVVAACDCVTAIIEMKHQQGLVGKNEVIVFFAKLFDCLANNPRMLLSEVCPIFLAHSAFDDHALAACLGLGIHAVSPVIRPLPILAQNVRCMEQELCKGASVTASIVEEVDDMRARVGRLSRAIESNSISSRAGYVSDSHILLKGGDALPLVDQEADRRLQDRADRSARDGTSGVTPRRLSTLTLPRAPHGRRRCPAWLPACPR